MGWGRRSLYHVKTLLSGIAAYAVNTGVLHHNPVREAKMVRTAPPTQTTAASLDDVLAILVALKWQAPSSCGDWAHVLCRSASR